MYDTPCPANDGDIRNTEKRNRILLICPSRRDVAVCAHTAPAARDQPVAFAGIVSYNNGDWEGALC